MSAPAVTAPATPATAPAVEREGAGRNLALATFAFTVCFFAWSLVGPLSPELQKQLALSDVNTSVMVAVPVLLGSIMRVPLGLFADLFGARRVFTGLMIFSILPTAALALWHDSLTSIVALGFLLGVAGASFAVGVVHVNGWYGPRRRGFALGVYGMGTGGTVVAALSAPRISDAYGLSAPFWLATGLLVVATVVFAASARDAAAPVPRTGPVRMLAPLAVFRRSSQAWALTLFYFLAFGGFVAMFLYLPKLLTGVHELTKTDAGTRAAGFALLAVLARPAGGLLADRMDPRRVLRACFAVAIVLATLLAFTYESMVPLTIGCLSLAVVLGMGAGAVFKLVAKWFPGEVGAVTGVVGAAGGLGGFFPPLVMGIVYSETGSYTVGFLLLALTAVGALVVAMRVSDPPNAISPA